MLGGNNLAEYELLRAEIVRSAVVDYKKALRKSDRIGYVCDEQTKMERWFLSKWGQMLSGDQGEYIIERCRKNYKAANQKLRSPNMTAETIAKAHKDYKAGMSKKEITKKYNITDYQYYEVLRKCGR